MASGGLPLAVLAWLVLFISPVQAQRIYSAIEAESQARRTIDRYNLDGRGTQSIVPKKDARPDELVIDEARNLLIWSERYGGDLYAIPIDGQPAWQLGDASSNSILALGGAFLYVGTTTAIRRVVVEPFGHSEVLAPVDASKGLAVDEPAGWIHWIEESVIWRMTLDGTDGEMVIDGLGSPSRLALDAAGQRLLWYDAASDAIWHGHTDGTGVERLIDTGVAVAFLEIDPVRRRVYWGGPDSDGLTQLYRSNLDGTGIERLRSSEVPFADIALDTRVCGGRGVRQGATCVCENGWSGTNCECPDGACEGDRECFGEQCTCAPQFAGEDCQYYGVDCRLRIPAEQVAEERGLRIVGAVPGGGLGFDVSAAGDVNADGYPDLVIGTGSTFFNCPKCTQGEGAGEAYVVFGAPGLTAGDVIDVQALDGKTGFRLIGMQPSSRHGVAVAGIGDINGDGIDDIACGNAEEDMIEGALLGSTFVVFGARDIGATGTIDVGSLEGTAGVVFRGVASGRCLAAAGDVNDDGVEDFLVGSPSIEIDEADPAAAAYLVFGGRGEWPAVIGLEDLAGSTGINGTSGVRLAGPVDVAHESFNGYCSLTVAGVGDIDEDGDADIMVGDPYRRIEDSQLAGTGYVVRGHGGNWPAVIDLPGLGGDAGFQLTTDFLFSGFPVSPAGDVNGDGVADMLLSAPIGHDSAPFSNAGWSYIVFGRDGIGEDGPLHLDDLGRGEALRFTHDTSNNPLPPRLFGSSSSSAGDMNGDGIDDVIIGTGNLIVGFPGSDIFYGFQEVYVLYGSSTLSAVGRAPLNAILGGAEGMAVVRDNPWDTSEFSRSVAGIGDINDDGYDDVAIGASGIESAGEVLVMFGGPALSADCNRNGLLDFCDIGSGSSLDDNGDGIPDECLPFIVNTIPPDGPIDARQPDAADGQGAGGWDQISMLFSSVVDHTEATDFMLTTTVVEVPIITRVLFDGLKVVLQLDRPIPPGACTIVHHIPSNSTVAVGFLPGDVGGDGVSNPQDILTLVDGLNGVIEPPLAPHQCDIDRSGACAPGDILRLVDLLNGAGDYAVWNGATLPDCP